MVAETGQKVKGKWEDSDYVRILANENGGVVNPFYKPTLDTELPISKNIKINTEDFVPDFIPESIVDIEAKTTKKMVDIKILTSKIEEVLDKI